MYQKIALFVLTLSLCAAATAQKPTENLATTSIRNFTISDLAGDIQDAWVKRDASVTDARTQLESQMRNEQLIALEAKARGVAPEALIGAQKSKVSDPNDQKVKEVFDANREQLAAFSPEDSRKRIIRFLRQDPEQAAMKAFTDSLAVKYKLVNGKDVNAVGLQPGDVIFTVAGAPYTAKDFEDKFKLAIYDVKADLYDQVRSALDEAIYSAIVAEEAKSQGVDAPTLLAHEITNKLHDFSDEERATVQESFLKRLYSKYKVNILITEPAPIVQSISTDDDPSVGPASAPVTVVMFSDFQCPACSATHPVLKKVLSEYGDKVRFVVRDFPLMSIHENAFQAARAAGAANSQGKFFEYIDILYTHQDALDIGSLKKYAGELGLNVKQFEIDLSSEKTAAEVQKDVADGRSYGIYSTPSIFVNGSRVRQLSIEGFRTAINTALKK